MHPSRYYFFCCLLFTYSLLQAQAALPLNLDFEEVHAEDVRSWNTFGNGGEYELKATRLAHGGEHSVTIRHLSGEDGFRAWGQNIKPIFTGKKLKLTGYLKTADVSDGFAGIWLRIDPDLGFYNMQDQEITGTNDWQRFELELDYDDKATNIAFGGLLVGKGQVWIDDLELTIDGKSISQAPARALLPAQQDTAFRQGSGLTFSAPLSPAGTRDLALLGKVWGLLKYHHPKIAAGELNWDFELFRALPKYQAAEDKSAFLLEWTESLGPVADCADCDLPTDAEVTADHAWITTDGLSQELQKALLHLVNNRPEINEHYYIGSFPGVGNPKFKNEDDYADMPYPDAGFRYLAAVRYWNMIHYYFPYRNEMDVDWDEALVANLPAIVEAGDEYAYERAMTRMIGQIKDTHANLWGGNDKVQEKRGKYQPPFRATFVEGQLTVVDYYDPEADLDDSAPQVGDVITHVNGRSVSDYIKTETEYFPASNPSARLRDIGENILRSPDSTTMLTLLSDGRQREVKVDLATRSDTKGYYRWYRKPDGPAYRMLDDNIGYLTLANVTDAGYAEAKKAFKDARGIIIDIRNYPTAFGPFAFGGFFLEEDTPFVKFTGMDAAHPGYFSMSSPLSIPADEESFAGKVIVLVNELSQSQAEYTSMAFRAGKNVTIMGSTTAGADGNVSTIYLPGGMRTMISGIGVFYPDGGKTQRVGIVPDMEVKPTLAGIKAGRDELLERAVEEILR